MYTVIKRFADLQDNRYVYNVDDIYPREGVKPTKKRISELASNKNKLKTPLIVEIEEVETEDIIE
ncbi:MAG: hypothetical protein IJ366_00570 [Clostridia bacterium]|nr:hypothetical protein [Clostridia bacterium]MBQ7792991.1 hypothetical protein [Clostridia bacterium]